MKVEVKELKDSYENYIVILQKEAKSMFGIAYVHGWTSQFVEEGELARIRIERALKEVENV